MRIERVTRASAKGWWAGAWNSPLPIAVGYATTAIDDPHVHQRVTEIYLVATGSSTLRIEKESVRLESGDMAIIDPGEAHTFTESSADYLHFVIHSPTLPAVEHQQERIAVPRLETGTIKGIDCLVSGRRALILGVTRAVVHASVTDGRDRSAMLLTT